MSCEKGGFREKGGAKPPFFYRLLKIYFLKNQLDCFRRKYSLLTYSINDILSGKQIKNSRISVAL
jgi:hypothetical protein